MTLTDELLIASTLLGPILAVQAQKWIERATEKRRRKLNIFHALMATRAARVAPDHVRALNQIDLEFSGARLLSFLQRQTPKEKAVSDAWRSYSDHLNQHLENETKEVEEWSRRGGDLFVDLLFALSTYFGFGFDRVQLRRGIYSPRAHGDADKRQQEIQINLDRMLRGEQHINMNVVGFPFSDEATKLQLSLQDAILKSLSPDAGIPVTIRPAVPKQSIPPAADSRFNTPAAAK